MSSICLSVIKLLLMCKNDLLNTICGPKYIFTIGIFLMLNLHYIATIFSVLINSASFLICSSAKPGKTHMDCTKKAVDKPVGQINSKMDAIKNFV